MKGAPGSFVLLLLFGLAAGFGGGLAWRGQEVANIESLVRVKEAEREFSERQLTEIKTKLSENPSSVDIIGGKTAKPDPRVDQLKSVFTDSGWSVGTKSIAPPNPAQNLTLRTPDDKAAHTLEKALNEAGVHYDTVKPNDASGVQEFQLKPSTF